MRLIGQSCNLIALWIATCHGTRMATYTQNQLAPALRCLLRAPLCARAMGRRQSPLWWLRAARAMLRYGQA